MIQGASQEDRSVEKLWNVVRRSPLKRGLGMTTDQASQWLRFFQRRFTLLHDREELLAHWHDLVKTLRIQGYKSHDARLAAAMQTYAITRLLTFNADDFKRFAITIVDPASV